MSAEEIVHALRVAKHVEDVARTKRIAIEEDLIEALGCKEEGSQTHDVGTFKVTITGKVNRALDRKQWAIVEPSIETRLRPTRTKTELDPKGCKWLQENRPEVWAKVAACVTTKPGKPSVTIKEA